jgi:hypothetical protein
LNVIAKSAAKKLVALGTLYTASSDAKHTQNEASFKQDILWLLRSDSNEFIALECLLRSCWYWAFDVYIEVLYSSITKSGGLFKVKLFLLLDEILTNL